MLFDSLFQVDSLEMVEDLVVVAALLLVDLALPSAQELMVWPSRHVPLQSLRHPHFFHFSVSGQLLVFPLGHHWLFHMSFLLVQTLWEAWMAVQNQLLLDFPVSDENLAFLAPADLL